LKTVFHLIIKDYRLFLSDRVAVSLTFLIPLLLITLWGSIFGNAGSGPDHLRLVFLNQSDAPIAKKIENVIDTTKTFQLVKTYHDEQGREMSFDTNSVKEYIRKGNATAGLVIPSDAFTDTSVGLKLKFYYDPKNDMEMRIINGVLQQTIMTQIPGVVMKGLQRQATKYLGLDSGKLFNNDIAQTVGKYFKIDPKRVLQPLTSQLDAFETSGSASKFNVFKNILQIEETQLVGQDIANPWATRSVGGWAMMFLMFTLTASSSSLFEEKKNGVVLRLLASPISRVQILWSKYLYNLSLGIFQLIVLFVGGSLLFKIDIYSNVVNLLLIIIAAAMACTAFGMLLSAISKSEAQSRGLGTFLILTMSSIGGAWFPTTFMPGYIQSFSKLTLVYWSMDGFLQVLWRGVGIVDLLPNLAVLLGMSVLITSISLWQFKKGHVF
jgi:ABC-2 type transport system permease protein